MSSVVIFRAPHVMIAIGLIVTFMGNASASPNTLTVQDPRPVAKAIQELDKRYGWQITYEDPPYSRYSDMPDVTPSVQEGSSVVPGASHVTVPNAAILSFPLPATNQDELTSVNAVVKIYNESHRGFAFAVMQGAGLLHVVPRQMTGLAGNLEPVTPVLDAVITIEPKERTAEEFLEEIFKKVSIATNTHLEMGTVSQNMLHLTKTSIGGSGTARSILEQWILELRGGFSGRLLYFPPDKTYSLNISQEAPVKMLILLPRSLPAGKP
jgi:hypothetical protein